MNLWPLFGDTADGWRKDNPVLPAGTLGVERIDARTCRLKRGDGRRRWNDLPYFPNATLASETRELDGGGA
jgi:hypothetical protein